MKKDNWLRLSIVIWSLSLVILEACLLTFAALEKLDAIDAEQDHAIAACKAPVRRTK